MPSAIYARWRAYEITDSLIADVLHSVGCGMAILTLSPTQSDTQSIAADHMRL